MNKPMQLSDAERAEIFEVPAIRSSWGLGGDPALTVGIWRESVYAVKFDFMSGCPGYVGDLFIVTGDALVACPVVLTRGRSGKLEPARLEHADYA